MKGIGKEKDKNKEGETLSESEWIEKVAKGSKDRKRILIEVPVVGNIDVDDD